MKTVHGNIPTRVTIISSGKTSVKPGWDDFEDDTMKEEEVTPAFVSDADNKGTLETGRRWAEERERWIYKDGKYIENKKNKIKEVTHANKPRSGYRVVDLQIRSEGGRAYKVVDPDGYYFDLREDVLLDTMLKNGIEPGGFLVGEFLWAKVGTQMKLVRKDSMLYERLIEATQRSNSKKVSSKELIIGGVYRNKKGEDSVFCGYVDTLFIKVSSRNRYQPPSKVEKVEKVKKAQLWFDVNAWAIKNGTVSYQQYFDTSLKENSYYNIKVKKTGSVVELVETIDVGKNVVDRMLEVQKRGTKESDLSVRKHLVNLSYDAEVYNMVPHGENWEPHPVYKTALEKEGVKL